MYTSLSHYVNIYTYSAASSVAAGIPSAFVDLNLTAGSSESWATGTGVAALAGVTTSGSIQAGLMMCAVVQICNRGGHMLSINPTKSSDTWLDRSWTAVACSFFVVLSTCELMILFQPASLLSTKHPSSLSRPF